jgi:hypothetical protein
MHGPPSKKWAKIFLRVGLAFVFVWVGLKSWLEPDSWIGFVPLWLENALPISLALFLKIHAVFNLVLGFWLLSGRWLIVVAAIASFYILTVLVAAGINDITFRDIGLLGASVALLIIQAEERESKSIMIG